MDKDFAIFVCSTDSYKDCWKPFFYLFQKYFTEYKDKIYLSSESKTFHYTDLDIINLQIGKYFPSRRPTWSESLAKALDLISETYILFLLDDLFFNNPVKIEILKEYIELAKKHECTYLGLGGNPGPFDNSNNKLWRIKNNADYAISLLPSIWNVKKISKYLRKHESPWQLEIYGTRRVNICNDNFYSVNTEEYGQNSIIPYPKRTGIIRGEWNKEVIDLFKTNNIKNIDFSLRGVCDPEGIQKKKLKRIVTRKYYAKHFSNIISLVDIYKMKLEKRLIMRFDKINPISLTKRIIKRLRIIMIDKPISPVTKKEKDLVESIRNEFKRLHGCTAQVDAEWSRFMDRLYELVMNNDMRAFLRWDVIKQTMFVGSPFYVKKELNYLKRSDWEHRWSKAIIESEIGHPEPCIYYPKSSGSLIHQAYHLAQFEEKFEKKIEESNFIFEFGGGYGSMCRLFHNLAFNGQYIIFDLPLFSALQRYYLKALSLPVISVESFSSIKENQNSIVCLSSKKDLNKIVNPSKYEKNKSLFIATWSLSEAPTELRDSISDTISHFDNILIAYSNEFSGVDNIKYFNKFRHNFKDMIWHDWEIEHLKGHHYIMGNLQN